MEERFACPVCTKRNWKTSLTYTFKRADFENQFQSKNYVTMYWAKRQHILQNIWLPGQDDVKLTSVYCDACGFMCYSPRPTDADLAKKYIFLNSFPQTKASSDPAARSSKITDFRALRIFTIARDRFKHQKIDVLDYGGYNGRLLKYFVTEGHNSYLVDYTEEMIPGVKRIGCTIADIPASYRFDMIICSHVLEHVVDPVNLLRSFRPFLKDDGIVYIEIPLEIWKGIPITSDPVTHINFFTTHSLRNAILNSKYHILKLRAGFQPYGEKYKRVAWAIASPQNGETATVFNSVKTKNLLHPGLLAVGRRTAEDIVLKAVLNVPSPANVLKKLFAHTK